VNGPTTLTGSGRGLAPVDCDVPVPTLTIAFGPVPARFGERACPGGAPFPLNRTAPVFPGGPLADPEVSRIHAELRREPAGGWVIGDLGSKNGTHVNGARVGADGLRLASGDVIRVGDTLLLFHETLCPAPSDHAIEGMLGHSDGARVLRAATMRCASSTATVLVLGETGAGKDLVARAVASIGRPGRPFVAFNAGAVPPALVDSTLFGHVRGAFTDAREARPGLFRAASGGTLFLDEVGDLAPETQVRLLRAVEERAVVPVGAVQPVPVDVRLVAATNRDLAAEAAAGRFRGDLYARLAGSVIRVPPLRDRRADVPLLATAFAAAFAAEATNEAAAARTFTPKAMTRLMLHPWPFNVRELKAVVGQSIVEGPGRGCLDVPASVLSRLDEHARLFAHDGSPAGSPAGSAEGAPSPAPSASGVAPGDHMPGIPDRAAVEAALARAGGNMTGAADALGKDRGQFYRIVRRLGIDPDRFR